MLFIPSLRHALVCGLAALLVMLAGCQSLLTQSQDMPEPSMAEALPMPLALHEFHVDTFRDDVVGKVQIITAEYEDTLSDIARRFNLGYEEIVSANPGVDPWLPGKGTPIVIPTQFILPDAPREGIVINLAAMRLFYYPPVKEGELQKVVTHPVGIGRLNWKTPEGATRITAKNENPVWIPTPSIHKEYARNGEPLPTVVPPGPDNPMGSHVLRLGWPAYAIHGTNKPPSIGLRGSFGCIRMYPEDVANIFSDVPVGTPVRVVNQPRLFGWRGDALYLQTYPIFEDDKRNHGQRLNALLQAARTVIKAQINARPHAGINTAVLDELIHHPRAIAIPVTQPDMTVPSYLEKAAKVQNVLPFNATWSGESSEKIEMADDVSVQVQ